MDEGKQWSSHGRGVSRAHDLKSTDEPRSGPGQAACPVPHHTFATIGMIQSGIGPVDTRTGFAPGRVHLLTGGIATGKTTACLQFLAAGLEADATAALLTLDHPAELAAHARFLGIDLASHVRAGRLRIVRFRPDFAWRLANAAPAASVADALGRELRGSLAPARVVVDPASPFLADGSAVGAGLIALVRVLDGLGCTSLLTYPGPITGEDRRLDAIVDAAALVAEVQREAEGEFCMRILRARLADAPVAPFRFTIEREIGIVESRSADGERRIGGAAAGAAPTGVAGVPAGRKRSSA